jgi:hypothetical protein
VESDEQPKNRRARRAAASGNNTEGDEAIKDPNRRLRAEAARTRKKTSDERVARASSVGLDASERFDDVFLRSTSAVGKFFGRYATALQSLIVLAAAGGMGYLIWNYRSDADNAKMGDRVAKALDVQTARLAADTTPRKTEFGLSDTRPEFADAEAKRKAVVDGWRTLEEGTPDGVREFAALGEATTLLDSGQFSEARKKFEGVANSSSPVVKVRALEGVMFTWEGEKNLDAALSAAQKLSDVAGANDLASYHEARLWLAKGDTAKALQLTSALKEKLGKSAKPLEARPYLLSAVEDLDKTLNPKPESLGSGLSPEAMEMLKKQLEQMQKSGGEVPSGDGPLPGPLAPAEPAP